MEEIIKNKIEKFLKYVKEIFGERLLSVILYGSAAKGKYVEGVSDINLIFIVDKIGYEEILRLNKIHKIAYKNRIKPFFFNKWFLISSSDVFPVEWKDIKENHIIIYGEDLTSGIEVKEEKIALQVERELKQNYLNFQQGLIFEKYKKDIILESIKNLKFLQKYIEMVVKKKIEFPDYFDEIEKTGKIKGEKINEIIEKHFEFLEKIIKIVDERGK